MWYTNQEEKGQKPHDQDAEEALNKIQHPFMIKHLWKFGIEVIYFNIIKVIYDKPTVNILLNGENVNASLLKSERRQGFLSHSISST